MQPVLRQHKYHHFGPYLAEMPVNPDYCAKLLKLGKKLKKSHRSNLAGQIHHEYIYPLETEPWIFNEFQIYINTWIEGFKKFSHRDPQYNPKYRLEQIWINRMRAKEYNPIHVHTHCDLSFVLFLEVPQRMLNERKRTPLTNVGGKPGDLCFLYGEEAWGSLTEKRFTPVVNTLFIFPATLRHQVLHFNSKVIRTSVAGNIKLL